VVDKSDCADDVVRVDVREVIAVYADWGRALSQLVSRLTQYSH
jgi:hypothetical protein